MLCLVARNCFGPRHDEWWVMVNALMVDGLLIHAYWFMNHRGSSRHRGLKEVPWQLAASILAKWSTGGRRSMLAHTGFNQLDQIVFDSLTSRDWDAQTQTWGAEFIRSENNWTIQRSVLYNMPKSHFSIVVWIKIKGVGSKIVKLCVSQIHSGCKTVVAFGYWHTRACPSWC